jgi:ketosteroid isomerase-like protein
VTTGENTEVVSRLYEAFAQGDVQAALGLMAPDVAGSKPRARNVS